MNLIHRRCFLVISFSVIFSLPILYYLFDTTLFNICLLIQMVLRAIVILFIITRDNFLDKEYNVELITRIDAILIMLPLIYSIHYQIPIIHTIMWNGVNCFLTWPAVYYKQSLQERHNN